MQACTRWKSSRRWAVIGPSIFRPKCKVRPKRSRALCRSRSRSDMRTLLLAGIATGVLLLSAEPGSSAEPIPGATVEDLLVRVRKFNPELAAAALDREAAVREGPRLNAHDVIGGLCQCGELSHGRSI